MKREEAPVYIWHWVLIIACIVAALVVRSRLQKSDSVESVQAQPVHKARDTRFVAVLYPRISSHAEPDSMSKSLFAEHMAELKRAGHYTVGLQQVCDLYDAGELLPEKSVAILLDGRRDTCLNAVPIIEELGLRATVMLNIGAMRQTSRSFMSWHDLSGMRRNDLWDFGIRTKGADDLLEQLDYLKDRFPDVRVCGVSAPTDLGDTVDFSRDKRVFFPPRGGDGYNSSISDPSRLSLLRVAPQQSGRELAAMLSNASSQAPRIENGFTAETARLNWISTCGDARVIDGMLELSAGPSRSSADAWSAGTYDWSDVDLAVKFKVTGGEQFWAYLRFRNEDSFIRMGCDGERLFLQQKVAGAKLKNLKVVELDHDSSQFLALKVILRGPFAIASVDGRQLSARPFRIDDSLVSGKIGFAIWDPARGVASCRIASVAIRKLPCIALMNMDWHTDSSGWIAEHSDYLSYLCPNGLSLEASRAEHAIDDYSTLLISSGYKGYMLAPTVLLDDNQFKTNDSDVLTNKLVDLVKNNRLESLHLDCRKWQGEKPAVELAPILTALKANLPRSGLMLSLSPQCYQSCEELLELADVLVLGLKGHEFDLLNDVARPFRLKTLLRIETDDPRAIAGGLVSPYNGRATGDSKGDGGVVQDHELKGIALCKR